MSMHKIICITKMHKSELKFKEYLREGDHKIHEYAQDNMSQ